jgi:TRAP-type C4-dicarboxylate transport system substrate-binding protein
MKKLHVLVALCLMVVLLCPAMASAETVLKYAHMNTVDNSSGIYAQYFADRVGELTNGSVRVEVYPNSQLGSIQEMAEMVSAGTIQLHHNTWGGLSVIMEKLELMDTPYLYASVEDAIKFNDITTSPILQEYNEELKQTAGVRILNSIYSGARELTCNKPVYSPADLKGVKIRAIP